MLSLSKNVAHDYDPTLAFSTHSSNLPHMTSWIDELVRMTEKSLPTRGEPTTTQLVECLQRYDAVFKEIVRQNVIFSEPLSKMTSKAWSGSLKLMDYMIKSYHKYVRHTAHLQDQARELLAERQAQIAASKIQTEEFELQRTIMRAKSRNLEAKVLSMQASNRGLEKEIAQLRTIISIYIQSKEMNEASWDMMDAHKDGKIDDISMISNQKDNFDVSKKLLEQMSRYDVELNESISLALKEEDLQRMLVSDLNDLMRRNKSNFHAAVKTWLKEPTEVVVETSDKYVQVDERDEYGAVSDMIESPRDFNPDQSPVVPDNYKILGEAIPFLIRRHMRTFPRTLRIWPLASLLQTIMAIYVAKSRTDQDLEMKNMPVLNMAEYVYEYYRSTLGVQANVDVQVVQLLTACAYHSSAHKRVNLFSYQIGLHDTEVHPPLDVRDTSFILTIIRELEQLGELVADPVPRGVTATIVFQNSILRSSAISVCGKLYKTWLQDGGDDCIMKLKIMTGTEKGAKYVDVDSVIDLFFDIWCSIRMEWEEHLEYLFSKHCSVYRVIGEVIFANDVLGVKDRDVMLVNIQKAGAADCGRRPMRLIQRPDSGGQENSDATSSQSSSSHHKKRSFKQGNANRETVCDAITKEEFFKVVELIKPGLTNSHMEAIFLDACEISFEYVSRALDRIWTRCLDDATNRHFYINKIDKKAQWTRPFHQRNFRNREIELDTFIKVILKFDLLATGPFVELLHNSPRDLWPNSEMFLKNQQQRQRRLQANRHEAKLKKSSSSSPGYDEDGKTDKNESNDNSYSTKQNSPKVDAQVVLNF